MLRHLRSALRKTAVSTLEDPRVVEVHPWGLEGDEQAETGIHGGRDKAVYMAPVEHWTFWSTQRAQRGLPAALGWGCMGENLSVEGILEHEVHAGDQLELGEVVLEVTEPRIPCLKFNFGMGYAQASRDMLRSTRSGWYCAVLCGGTLRAGVPIVVRPGRRLVSIAGALAMRQNALNRQLDLE
jgi:MOSC domain-containing protein YiiM